MNMRANQLIEKPNLQEQHNKQKEKEDAAAEATRTRCKTCFKETSPRRICGGHGGGGGAGGDQDSSSKQELAGNDTMAGNTLEENSQATPARDQEFVAAIEASDKTELNLQRQLDEPFNPEIIFYLLLTNRLTVESNRENRTLTIQLQCDPESLTEKQRIEFEKFVDAILNQLDEFKKEQGITTECAVIDEDDLGNILALRITLPTLALYDKFIQRLGNNLLPSPTLIREEKSNFNPSPLSTKPNPSKNKETPSTEADEKQHETLEGEQFYPSPLSNKPKYC